MIDDRLTSRSPDDDPLAADGPRLVARPDPLRWGFLTVVCVMMGAAAGWMMTTATGWPLLGGVVGVLFFGGGSLFMIHRLIVRRPSVIIDRRGIYESSRRIPWEAIESIADVWIQGNRMLEIMPYDHAEIPSTLATRIRRRLEDLLGFPGIYLNFRGLNRSLDQAIEFIETEMDFPVDH